MMNPTMIEIEVRCPVCGKTEIVVAPFEGYTAWNSGVPIQEALPCLSADERELLLSGICPTCWDKLFG